MQIPAELAWPATFVLTLLAITISDIAYRKVFNEVVGWGLLIVVMEKFLHGGMHGVSGAFFGAILVAGVLLPSYIAGLMGAADVKAGFLVGSMVGSSFLVAFFWAAVFATFVGACGILLGSAVRREKSAAGDGPRCARNSAQTWSLGQSLNLARQRGTTLPFAACLSVGAIYAGQGGLLWL